MDGRKGMLVIGFLAFAIFSAVAAPLNVMAIGDSMTEEYRFESIVFSGPESNPLQANTNNWVELLVQHRAADFSFGRYEPSLLQYPDFRDAGYEFNFGVPSFETGTWVEVINSTVLDLISGDAFRTACYSTKLRIIDQLRNKNIGVVVIFLGGNDQNGDYRHIAQDPEPPALLADAVSNIAKIHKFVRDNHATVPIVICTFPDIGATHKISSGLTDPAARARARQRIADANAALIAKAGELGATVARVDQLTDRIFDEHPFHLNGTEMIFAPHPDNPSDRIFCRDGFHPSTVGQALIGNLIIDAINRATGRSIALFQNREILGNVLQLNPDQPYLAWASSAGGMTSDADGDGVENLVEFLLGASATAVDSHYVFSETGGFSFPTSAEALRFADLKVMESQTLDSDWTPVPDDRIDIVNGVWSVAPNGASRNFYCLEATPKP
jgi:lysophospholipase L1-like esterase